MIARIPKIILLLSLLAALLGGCRTTPPTETLTDDLDITAQLDPDPPQIGAAILVLTILNAQGGPVSDAHINVRGDMNHAGMRPVLREVDGGEGGVYRIPFEWTMGGDWFVDVEITLPDGTIARRRFDYTVTTDTSALLAPRSRG